MGEYFETWKKYATFRGRATRAEFWSFFLTNLIVAWVLSYADYAVLGWDPASGQGGPFVILYSLAVLLPGLAVAARRLHDAGQTAWLLLLLLLPIVGGLILLVFFILNSKPDNKYGPNPKSPTPAESTVRPPDPVPAVTPADGARPAGRDAPSKRPRPWKTVIVVAAALAVGFGAALLWSEAKTGGDPKSATATPSSRPSPTTEQQYQWDLDFYICVVNHTLLDVWPTNPAFLTGERVYPVDGPPDKALGLARMVEDHPNLCRSWGSGREAADELDEWAVELARDAEPPANMRSANQKLVRALRMEAERWRRFARFQKADDEEFWPRYEAWRTWSRTQLHVQQRLLGDWYFTLRVRAGEASVRIPRATQKFVSAALACSQ